MPNLVIGTLEGPSILSTTPYPTTWKAAVEFITQNTEVITELTAADQFFNSGDSVPALEYQDFPWFNHDDDRWYRYHDGAWLSKHPSPASGSEVKMWIGSLASLSTYDGGDASSLGDASGPMWEEYTDAQARMPLHPGTLPISSTVVSVGGTGGLERVGLTQAEGSAIDHKHAFGVHVSNDDVRLLDAASPLTIASQNSHRVSGDNSNIEEVSITSADLVTSLPDGNTTPVSAHQNMPPYIGVYMIKRTSRIYYKAV